VLAQARAQDEARVAELGAEQRGLDRDLAAWHAEARQLSTQVGPGDAFGPRLARLADLQERITAVEARLRTVREQAAALRQQVLDPDAAATALSVFDPVWESLTPLEQVRVVRLLVRRVDYDGARGKVAITFHPTGIKTLADERSAGRDEENRA
jgi:site-specific DNA recombinase